ncbi:MAG: hypothetical protein KBT19_09745 [Lachnospiraceae bacterium]|nr:hypothetical protein [Candidatus Colinaster equi]
MKKKVFLTFVMCIGSICLGGCGLFATVPTLDDDQTKLVTEYAAGLILRQNEMYDTGVLDEEALKEAEADEALEREKERKIKEAAADYLAKTQNKNADNADDHEGSSDGDAAKQESEPAEQVVDNVAAFYGIEGFDVNYTGYDMCKSYPEAGENLIMSMDATPGKNLCIVKFDVTNNSGADASFDMFYRSPDFYLIADGEKVHYQSTLLLDDMAAYNGDLPTGQTTPMVLVFEVDEASSSLGAMSLYMKNGDVKGTMNLQ